MALSADKFSEALSPHDYIQQMKVNRAPFEAIYESIEIPGEVQGFFDGLSEPVNLAVFHAEWCGDAVSTTPAILRLAESSSKINVGVFNRDEEVDLTNTFVPEHRANTVPVFVVFDQQMGEIARFIETARSLVPQIDAMDDAISQEVAQEADAQADNARALTRGKRTAFRISHGQDWGKVILQEFQQVVSDGLALPAAERPAEGGTEWPVPEA